jgi:hypothetical protein
VSRRERDGDQIERNQYQQRRLEVTRLSASQDREQPRPRRPSG